MSSRNDSLSPGDTDPEPRQEPAYSGRQQDRPVSADRQPPEATHATSAIHAPTPSDIRNSQKIAILALAVLAQNTATGIALGSFAPMIAAMQDRLDADLTGVSFAVSFMLLAMGLSAPLVGYAINRFGIFTVMVAGSLSLATGYAALSFLSSLWAYLLVYASLIGPGMAMLGFVPSASLVNRYLERHSGAALGIATAPLGMLALPFIASWLLSSFGLARSFQSFAVFCLLVALAVGLVFRIAGDEPKPSGATVARDRIKRPTPTRFVMLSLALGLLIFPGTMAIAHLPGFAKEAGASGEQTITLLALQGGSGIVGALMFGWLCDQVGPARALALNAMLQGCSWFLLTFTLRFPELASLVFVTGACSGGVMACFTALIAKAYNSRDFPQLMGFASVAVVPFTFGAAPIVAFFFDRSGSYHFAMLLSATVVLATTPIWLATRKEPVSP